MFAGAVVCPAFCHIMAPRPATGKIVTHSNTMRLGSLPSYLFIDEDRQPVLASVETGGAETKLRAQKRRIRDSLVSLFTKHRRSGPEITRSLPQVHREADTGSR
jgi:hypothetical protein